MKHLNDVAPDQALRDPRIISRANYDHPNAQDGKYYLILKDQNHLIFVNAFQHNNKNINPSGQHWSGGTQIEIPTQGFIWFMNTLESLHPPKDSTEPRQPRLIEAPEHTINGEQLALCRTLGEPGYALKNYSRKIHLPWANDNWIQKLALPDELLFEQDYYSALKKLAAQITTPITTQQPTKEKAQRIPASAIMAGF